MEGQGQAPDAYGASDEALEHVEKRLRRYKRRLKDHSQQAKAKSAAMFVLENPVRESDAEDLESSGKDEPMIISEKSSKIRTLTPFHAKSVLCDLHVSSKKQLFQEMATKLIEADALADSGIACRDIVQAAMERERLGSTGVGTGVALPHARLGGIERVHAVFARLAAPNAESLFTVLTEDRTASAA